MESMADPVRARERRLEKACTRAKSGFMNVFLAEARGGGDILLHLLYAAKWAMRWHVEMGHGSSFAEVVANHEIGSTIAGWVSNGNITPRDIKRPDTVDVRVARQDVWELIRTLG